MAVLKKRTLQAETFIKNHQSEAKLIIQNRLNITSIDEAAWSNHQFSLSLEQSLVIAMKDEAQWMITINHLTNQTQVPNIVDYIYTDGLKAVKARCSNHNQVGERMRLSTQFKITLIVFSLLLIVIGASIVVTSQQVAQTRAQENLANRIVQGASDLTYLSNDYVIYQGDQQLSQWQARYASFSKM